MRQLHVLTAILALSVPLNSFAQDAIETESPSPAELISGYYNEGFRPFKKGNYYAGLAFSVNNKSYQNYTGLLLTHIESQDNNYDVTVKGGYFIGNYAMAGLEYNMSQTRFSGSLFISPDTVESNSIVRSFAFKPNIRTVAPLNINERLSFFTVIGLGLGYESGLTEQTRALDEITRTFHEEYTLGIGISPGITFFAMENFAFEIQLNVVGYELSVKEKHTNYEDVSRQVRHKVNFDIDLLSLEFGLAYYIITK